MACGCQKNKSNQQTSAQVPTSAEGFAAGDAAQTTQEPVASTTASTSRIRRG